MFCEINDRARINFSSLNASFKTPTVSEQGCYNRNTIPFSIALYLKNWSNTLLNNEITLLTDKSEIIKENGEALSTRLQHLTFRNILTEKHMCFYEKCS